MDDEVEENGPKRGTALLVLTMIVIAFSFAFIIVPRAFGPPNLTVRVAVIDSGINMDGRSEQHVIAEMSFVNETYGYEITDMSTSDSEPKGSVHGTYVTNIILDDSPNAAIINAKVVNSRDIATALAVIAAIRWAVIDQNCDVINLSIGSTPNDNDGIKEVISWAFRQGVSIIAAVGNNGQNGVTGSSIESPALYPEVIGVGAIDESDNLYSFSGYGPTIGRLLKPDISAPGYYSKNSVRVLGTSFAAPIITAATVNLIQFCEDHNWRWTPGLIKAALLSSARFLNGEPWQVGAGAVDLEAAKGYIESAEKLDGLPLLAWVEPNQGIFDFERWFLNTTNRITIQIFASTNATFKILKSGIAAPWVTGPAQTWVNQSGSVQFEILVDSPIAWRNVEANIIFLSDPYRVMSTTIAFDVSDYVRIVGFDFTHTSWWMDSIYGQFRRFYSNLASIGIAVEEIRNPNLISYDYLRRYDAIIIFDPAAWEFKEIGEDVEPFTSVAYTQAELDAYASYWNKGGGILIAGGSNNSLDIVNANKLLSIFNVSLNFDNIPSTTFIINGMANAIQVTNITTHPATEGVASFDYNGASLQVQNISNVLAYENFYWMGENGTAQSTARPVLVAIENERSSRAIISGTNFFMDNWGLSGLYGADDDWILLRRCIYWITKIF